MVDFFQAIRDGAKSAYCATALPLASVLQLGGGLYKGLGGEVQGEDLQDSANLLRNASNLVCNRPTELIPPNTLLPFQGGQCPGEQYRANLVTATYDVNGTPTTVGPGGFGIGPGPLTFEQGEGFRSIRAAVGGILATIDIRNIPGASNLRDVQFSVVTNDGSPDDCGNPPPATPPYDAPTWTVPTPVTYDDDNGSPVAINPTFVFEPGGPTGGGGFSVPFTVNFEDGSSLFGDFNLSTGDINVGIGNSSGDGVTDEPRELPPDEDPEASDSVVIGVRVVATESGTGNRATELLQSGGNPTIWIPRLGNVSFKYETEGGTGWGTDIPVKNEEMIIWAEMDAVNVKGTPEDGWEFELFPIIKVVVQESCCS